ncbi:MAG: hypothetical protein PHW12_02425 [Smithella sp.]|nr:hypothetical protein [Smithella sp.]MDD5673084.1 hypothetical protein [Chitinivibrionales bacterium]
MVFKVFDNGKLIGIINKANIDIKDAPDIKITGAWEGTFPFANITNPKTLLELRRSDFPFKRDVHITGAVLAEILVKAETDKKDKEHKPLDVLVTLAVNMVENPSKSLEELVFARKVPPIKLKKITGKPGYRISSVIANTEYYKYDEKLFTKRIIDNAYDILERSGLGDEISNLEYELQGANLFKTLKILQEYFLVF